MHKRSFKGPSAKFRIALGVAGLLMSLLLTADVLSLIPDRISAQLEGRTALAEAVAANNTLYLTRGDYRRMESVLRLVVERNPELLSAAMRRADGKIIVDVGEHDKHWQVSEGNEPTDSSVQVPIWGGDKKWGQVELRYKPLNSQGWQGTLEHPLIKLIAFMSILGFLVFYLYLGKMLKHLDPSEAIPDRVRDALDTMAEGLLVLDRKEQIVLANQAFSRLVERKPQDLVGFKASDFNWAGTADEHFDKKRSPWRKALAEGKPQVNTMVRLETTESEWRTFMVNCSPVLGEGNKAGGVLISLDDVTALEEKEIELRKSKDEAEAANRAKSDFLANMSHEIRTPMNAILGFTEVLKRGYGKNGQDAKKHLNTIHSSGKHLLALINDILDLSKVEAGRIEMERVSCDPYAIILEIVQILGIKAREKGITLDFEPDGPAPETIFTDPPRLRQILTNLVGNSLKFTEQGGVKIVTRLIDTAQNPQLALDIIDTGIGMTEAQQQKIFDPFVQADTSITRRFGGTGLGLSISLRFAEALGGGISVRSTVGEGSVFTVMLDTGPLQDIRMLQPEELLSKEQEVTAEASAQWQFASERILVVDDGSENRELVKLVLEEVGLKVDTAVNGRTGSDMALAEAYDMILMDVQMPVMDGYAATRLLRDKGVEIPIFALTAHAMSGTEQKCLAGGFTGVLTKPIDIDGLINTLAEQLECRHTDDLENTPETMRAAETPEETSHLRVVEPADGPPIISRLATANPRFRDIIERFTERLGGQLDAMEQAWAKKDFEELKALAHWLKGAGGTVGFDDFTKPAQQLEQSAWNGDESVTGKIIDELRQLSLRVVLERSDSKPIPDTGKIEQKPSDAPVELISRLPQDNPRIQQIIQKFVTRLLLQLDAMDLAWERNEFDELANLAHWLKGSGGTVGFDAFTEPAKRLEQCAKAHDGQQSRAAIDQLRHLSQCIVIPEEKTRAQMAR